MTRFERVRSSLRRPEYTGDNRCIPCTVVNVLLAGGVSAGITGLTSLGIGLGSFVVFAVLIYFRGYLVPGTPALTQRYLPGRVLRWFGKRSVTVDSAASVSTVDARDQSETESVDPEAVLRDVGALAPSADGTDLRLTDEFARSWDGQIQRVASTDVMARLGRLLGRDPDDLSAETTEDGSYVLSDGETTLTVWASEAALLADLAAARELERRYPAWTTMDVTTRGTLLQGLRVFLEECPACDGPLTLTEKSTDLCCGLTMETVTLECTGCGAVLFTGRTTT